jgi:hypothetical protein
MESHNVESQFGGFFFEGKVLSLVTFHLKLGVWKFLNTII